MVRLSTLITNLCFKWNGVPCIDFQTTVVLPLNNGLGSIPIVSPLAMILFLAVDSSRIVVVFLVRPVQPSLWLWRMTACSGSLGSCRTHPNARGVEQVEQVERGGRGDHAQRCRPFYRMLPKMIYACGAGKGVTEHLVVFTSDMLIACTSRVQIERCHPLR